MSHNVTYQDTIQYLLVGRPRRSYEDVLYTNGHMMVAKKGVAERVGLVDGRHVLQNEVFVSLWYLSPVKYFRKERS